MVSKGYVTRQVKKVARAAMMRSSKRFCSFVRVSAIQLCGKDFT